MRAVDAKNIDTTMGATIKGCESIDKLIDGIESFNEYIKGSVIHMPYLGKIQNGERTVISIVNLSGANLSYVNLSYDNLSETNLSG